MTVECNDTIRACKEDDILIGGNGSDLLAGDRGQDMLTGGGGNDTFILAGGLSAAATLISADVITDLAIGDKIGLTDGIHGVTTPLFCPACGGFTRLEAQKRWGLNC